MEHETAHRKTPPPPYKGPSSEAMPEACFYALVSGGRLCDVSIVRHQGSRDLRGLWWFGGEMHYGAGGVLGFDMSRVSGVVLWVAVIYLRDQRLYRFWARVSRSL